MTDENLTPEQRIQKAAEEVLGTPLSQEDVDAVQVYHMEQHERAEELYQSAVGDGVNFAIANDEGDVFVNTKWLGMVAQTIAEAMLVGGDNGKTAMTAAEILGQTVLAARKFTGVA